MDLWGANRWHISKYLGNSPHLPISPPPPPRLLTDVHYSLITALTYLRQILFRSMLGSAPAPQNLSQVFILYYTLMY